MPAKVTRAVACALALMVCSLLLVIARGAADAPATSDTAVIESYVRMAGDGQLLVGAYSRYQWHHPGPLYFYLLAPLYRLGGARTAALNAGASVLSLASLSFIVWVCCRRRPALAVPACAVLSLFAWRAGEALASPWNPHVPVLALVALMVAAADVIAGGAWSMPVTAVLASLSGQAHVALMPVSLIAAAAAFARTVVGAAGADGRAWRRSLLATAAALAACWALPFYEQFRATPTGNITELSRFFLHRTTTGQSLAVAVSAWSDMFIGVLRPDFYVAHGWPFVESPVLWAEWTALLVLGALALSVARSARRRDVFTLALSALLVACAAVGLWSATRIEDRIFDHDLFWLSGLGALAIAVSLDAVMAGLMNPSAWRAAARVAVLAGAVVMTTAAVTQVRRAVALSRQPSDDAVRARALAEDLRRYLDARRLRRPFVTIDQDSWGVVAGALLDLQKHGRLVSVEEDWVVMFTPLYRRTGAEDAVIHIAMPDEHARLQARGLPVIASHGPIWAHVEALSE